MKPNLRPFIVKAAKVLAALIVVWIIAGFVFWWWFWRSVSVDYSTKPSEKVFKLVLNQNVPNGVSNLKVAGHGVLMGHTVWMKFSATDAAIAALLKNKKLSFDEPDKSFTWITKEQILNDQDAHSIRWDTVLRAKNLESYRYSYVPSGIGWVGEIIIDRETRTIYTNSGAL